MSYFDILLTRRQRFCVLSVIFLAGAFSSLINLPFHTQIESSDQPALQLPDVPRLNLPCSAATLKPGTETLIRADVTGKGVARVSYILDGDELKLRHMGLLQQIDCTLNITLGPNKQVQLPAAMPFAARDGVHPAPLGGQPWRTFRR